MKKDITNPFKNLKLDKEKQQILKDFEKCEFVSIKNFEEEKKRLQRYARNTLNKRKNINIRISMRDLHRLKVKAMEEGIPYQTLASSILHKYVAQY